MTADSTNSDLAITVDLALLLAKARGARRAAAFLLARGAGFALICRVLAEPNQRRAHDLDLPPDRS